MHQSTCLLFPDKLYLPSLESLAPESTKDSLAPEDLRGDRSSPRLVWELSFVLGILIRLVFFGIMHRHCQEEACLVCIVNKKYQLAERQDERELGTPRGQLLSVQ